MRVFFDTNFAIDLFRFRVNSEKIFDLLTDAELYTTQQVVAELKNLQRKKGRDAKLANIALKFFESSVKILKVEAKNADESLLRAGNGDKAVATNDRELRKKLKQAGVKTIYLRSRKHLAMD